MWARGLQRPGGCIWPGRSCGMSVDGRRCAVEGCLTNCVRCDGRCGVGVLGLDLGRQMQGRSAPKPGYVEPGGQRASPRLPSPGCRKSQCREVQQSCTAKLFDLCQVLANSLLTATRIRSDDTASPGPPPSLATTRR